MSKLPHKVKAEAQLHRKPRPNQTEIKNTVEQLDTTLQKLCQHTIPAQPYQLSVPSDVPWRHNGQFVNAWYVGSLFTEEEEQLQYLSFLSYQGEEDSLLKVVGGWADDKGNLLEEDAASPASLSGQNTPIEQPNRKKISLKDYKTKDKIRPNTPTIKAPVEDLRKQVMKSEAKEYASKVEDRRNSVKTKSNPVTNPEKRSGSGLGKAQTDGSASPTLAQTRREDLPSPRKRRRLSSESTKRKPTITKVERQKDTEDFKHLPTLLSPTLPAAQDESSRKALPGLLLPDLPPALEKLVAKVENKSKLESSSTSRTLQVKHILGSALNSAAEKRPPEKTSENPAGERSRVEGQSSIKTLPTGSTPKVQSPAIKAAVKPLSRPVTPLPNGVSASPKPRQRHNIILKYGKKNKKRVEALLRFPARPKKVKPIVEEPVSKPSEVKPISAKTLPDPEKVDRKRPGDSSTEPPSKKLKAFETPEKPKPSVTSAVRSPAPVVVVTKQKADIATPKKELKSSAMKRIESQDSMGVRTPLGDRGKVSTPNPAVSSVNAKVSPGPSTSVSKEDRAGWQEINTKCFALGRTLKHEGTSLSQSSNSERNDKDQALSVVLLTEALLCFMINHAAQAQARPSADIGWSTIMPYHIFVFRASRKFRHLHGLVIQLGAVCRQAIHNYDIERLAREPLPLEHFESAPTPGSDGVTRQNEDVDKLKKKYVNFRDQLVHNARELQSAWLEGSRYLSPSLIERDYPKTWAKRTKDTSKRGVEKLKPDAIGREYFLPIDANSTAFEATRFSIAFLREWTEKEKIEWKPRIEL